MLGMCSFIACIHLDALALFAVADPGQLALLLFGRWELQESGGGAWNRDCDAVCGPAGREDAMAESVSICMVRRDLKKLPAADLPRGFHFRTFRRGDENVWAQVLTESGNFESFEAAAKRFTDEFSEHLDEMESRCFFVVHDDSGREVGTATAWYNEDFQGENYGRLHWVGLRPEFHGRGLGKAIVARATRRLVESHAQAYLWTQSRRTKAVNIYLDFGFEPLFVSDTCEQAWRELADVLRHPALERHMSKNE